MKKIILSTLGFLGSLTAFSQMYVSPSSYMFVNNQYVYVKQDVNIQANGNVYLRNNSQLLQGGTGAGANAGAGDLSVFQEGTVNNFQYNYWCSPVGAPAAAAGNNAFGIARLFNPTSLIASTAAANTGGYDGTSSPLVISNRWIYRFITSNAYAQWAYAGSTSTINAGEGFTMKGTSGTNATVADANDGVANNSGSAQRYDFRGKPNDGTIAINVSTGNFTLVGNPYPSAIDLNMYLRADAPGPDTLWGTADDIGLNNTSINGTAYFWEQVTVNSHYLNQYEGGYGTYTPGSGYTPADFWNYNGDGTYNVNLVPSGTANLHLRFAPIGQGFMVRGVANGTAVMENSYRIFKRELEVDASPLAREANLSPSTQNGLYYDEIPNVAGTDYTTQKVNYYAPQIALVAFVNDGGYMFNRLGFANGYSDAFEIGADTPGVNEANPISFYQVLEGTNTEFRTSLTSFDINKGYPIGFRSAQQARFQIRVSEFLYGFDLSANVYIHDKQTGIYHDIVNGVFDMTLPAGNNNTRFEITFKNTDAVLATPDEVDNMFTVVQNNEQGMLTIYNTYKKDIKSVALYDITGKLVLNKEKLGTNDSYQFSTGTLSDGVYVVKALTTDNINLSKKVSIYKK